MARRLLIAWLVLRILRRSSAFVVGGLMTLAIACGDYGADKKKEDDDQFREDTLSCEEALAHLQECCPNFDPNAIACRYYYSSTKGCSKSEESREQPAFNIEESRCIRNTSCAGLQRDVCSRAAAAVQYIDRSSTERSSTPIHQTHPPVCP